MREQLKGLMEMQRTDYLLKTVTFSIVSMLVGFAFALYNGVIGIVCRSLWNGAICVYYFLLAGIRAIIISLHRKEAAGRHKRDAAHRRKTCFATHMVLILMNISLVVPAAVMVTDGRSYTYGLIPAIAMAVYTTYRITMSIIHYKRSRHNANIYSRCPSDNSPLPRQCPPKAYRLFCSYNRPRREPRFLFRHCRERNICQRHGLSLPQIL